MVSLNNILVQFYLDPKKIALTHDPKWAPSQIDGYHRILSQTRAKKLHIIDLEFDNTLWMPTRIRLDETDLLVCSRRAHSRVEAIMGTGPSWLPDGHEPCPWNWCPVIALAVNTLWWALPTAIETGEQSMMLGDNGDLVFRVHGTDVTVQYWDVYAPNLPGHSSRTPRQATVPRKDLVAAWELFSEEVRTQFLEVLPELADHVEYGPWFREGLDYLRQ